MPTVGGRVVPLWLVAVVFVALHAAIYWWLARHREFAYLRGHVIGVDVDGLLGMHRERFCEVLQHVCGGPALDPKKLDCIPVRECEQCKSLEVGEEDEITVFHEPCYWTEMSPYPNAASELRKLHDVLNYTVLIFSWRPWPNWSRMSPANRQYCLRCWTEALLDARAIPAGWWRSVLSWAYPLIETRREGYIISKLTRIWLGGAGVTFDGLTVEKGNVYSPYPRGRVANRFVAARRREMRVFVEDDLAKAVRLAGICEVVFLIDHHRIQPDGTYEEDDRPRGPVRPILVGRDGDTSELFKNHFGKPWDQFGAWLDERGFDAKHPPREVWISAVMTYWWESVRDLTIRLRQRWGKRTTIILGGVYPTLCPDHAARMTAADVVVAGEIEEANDLWTDLSLYERTPTYAVITPSRGCRFSCAYCAQRRINNGRRRTEHRSPEDIVAEMRDKHDRLGIRDFAFYADALLADCDGNFQRVLELVVDGKLPFRPYAPEGMDVTTVARSDRLADLLRQAHMQKLYLPVERLDEGHLKQLGRGHSRLAHVPAAVDKLVKAGFKARNMDINAFVLYGLPGEEIADVVRTVLWVSEMVGSVIPMLFTPVPTTKLYKQHLPWFRERGWDRDLHMLNGKLYPFLEMNEGSISDYVDVQRLMYMLNAHFRDRSFRVFGDTRLSQAFRDAVSDPGWLPSGRRPRGCPNVAVPAPERARRPQGGETSAWPDGPRQRSPLLERRRSSCSLLRSWPPRFSRLRRPRHLSGRQTSRWAHPHSPSLGSCGPALPGSSGRLGNCTRSPWRPRCRQVLPRTRIPGMASAQWCAVSAPGDSSGTRGSGQSPQGR